MEQNFRDDPMSWANRKRSSMTFRERIGYKGEQRALQILEHESFSKILWFIHHIIP